MKIRFLAVFAVAVVLPSSLAHHVPGHAGLTLRHNELRYGRCEGPIIDKCTLIGGSQERGPLSLKMYNLDCEDKQFSVALDNGWRYKINECILRVYPTDDKTVYKIYNITKFISSRMWFYADGINASDILNHPVEVYINKTMIKSDCSFVACNRRPQKLLRCHTPLMTYERDVGRMNQERKARVVLERMHCSNNKSKILVTLDLPITDVKIRAEVRIRQSNELISNATLERNNNHNKLMATQSSYVLNSVIMNMDGIVPMKVMLYLDDKKDSFHTCDVYADACKPDKTELKCMLPDKKNIGGCFNFSIAVDDECRIVIYMEAPYSTSGYVTLGYNKITVPIKIDTKKPDPSKSYYGSASFYGSLEGLRNQMPMATFTEDGSNMKKSIKVFSLIARKC